VANVEEPLHNKTLMVL